MFVCVDVCDEGFFFFLAQCARAVVSSRTHNSQQAERVSESEKGDPFLMSALPAHNWVNVCVRVPSVAMRNDKTETERAKANRVQKKPLLLNGH